MALTTYKKPPVLSKAISTGDKPPVGVRDTSVMMPVDWAMENSEMLSSAEFATYRYFPEGCSRIASGARPEVNGLFNSVVNTPELGSSRKTTIWLVDGRVVKT